MSGDANLVVVCGRLGREPERRGNGPWRVSVAVNERWQDKAGQWQERTSWVPVVAWGATGERLEGRASVGDTVLVEGRLSESSWKTPEGEERKRLEVVAASVRVLTPRGERRPSQPKQRAEAAQDARWEAPPPEDDDAAGF